MQGDSTTTFSKVSFNEITYLFFSACARPTFSPLSPTLALARCALPISFFFFFPGLGSLTIQSGTDCPDCMMTFAILCKSVSSVTLPPEEQNTTHDFKKGASSSVKYVMAIPSRPALPVRPRIPKEINIMYIYRLINAHQYDAHNSARSQASQS